MPSILQTWSETQAGVRGCAVTVPQSSVLSPDAWTARTSWRLEVLGQYWANISVQSRRHVALPGRSLEFGRRFFRSF
jgi:hypothetical protein